MLATSCYGIAYTTIRVKVAVEDGKFNNLEKGFYIPTFTLKLILDVYCIILFIISFTFFMKKKLEGMRKGARGFTRFNFFILYSIYFLLFMRIIGSIYTFIIGIISMTPVFDNDA